jgi:Transposase
MPERRKYDAEFREGAVTIVRETGRPIAEVARDLGIGAGTLGSWVKKDRLARGGGVRWRVEVVDYATDYATALAGFDVNGSGDFALPPRSSRRSRLTRSRPATAHRSSAP